MFPPVYTEDLLADYVANARALREALGVPLVLEPIPTYLPLPTPQLGEVEFVHRFYAESGCDMLLDVSHAWLSAHYAGLSPRESVVLHGRFLGHPPRSWGSLGRSLGVAQERVRQMEAEIIKKFDAWKRPH